MEHIPALTIVFLFGSMAVWILLTLFFLIAGRKKYQGKLRSFWGAALTSLLSFVVFVLLWNVLRLDTVLEKLLSGGSDDNTYSVIYASIRTVAEVLISTAAVWIYFRITRRREAFGNAWTFGAGLGISMIFYPIFVAFFLSCVTVILNLAGKTTNFQLPVSRLFVTTKQLSGAESIGFFYEGVQYATWLLFFVAFSVMLFVAVRQKLKWPVFTAAFAYCVLKLPALMYDLHTWYWNEALVLISGAIVTVIMGLAAYKLYSDYYAPDRKNMEKA